VTASEAPPAAPGRDRAEQVARLLGLHRADLQVAGWLVALFAVIQAGHGLGSNTGDALFFTRFGVEYLPRMILLSGGVVLVATVGYAAAMSRVGLARLLPVAAWLLAAVLVGERLLVLTDVALVYAAIWLTEQIVVLVTFTMMWGAAAEACDARQAKRLFPVLASAGIMGGLIGNLVTGPLAVGLGTANLLLVHAALLGMAGQLLALIAARFLTPAVRAVAGPLDALRASPLDELRAGMRAARTSPLFRLTSIVAFLFSPLFFLVVVPFAEVVTDSFAGEAQVAAFLGYFSAAATAASFLVSLLGTNRLLARFGVVGVVLIVPLVYAVGFGLWAVSFSLVTAAAVRGAQWVAVNAIGGTAWQSLFNVVRPPVRGQVTAFVAAVPTQLGVVAGGVVLTFGVADLPIRWLATTGAVLAIGAAAVVWRMRAAYVGDLLTALRGGLGDVFAAPARSPRPPALGATARHVFAEALADDRPARRRVAVGLLGMVDDAPLELVLPVVGDPDPAVRAAAVAVLAGAPDDPSAVAACRAALADEAAEVRRAAARVTASTAPDALRSALDDSDPQVRAIAAAAVGGDRGAAVLRDLLDADTTDEVVAGLDAAARWPTAPVRDRVLALRGDPRSAVRRAAGSALASRSDRSTLEAALELLDDPDPWVCEHVASALGRRDDATDLLAASLRNGGERAQLAAVRALRGHADAAGDLAAWATRRTGRAVTLRRYRTELAPHATTAQPAASYLDRVLAQREWQAVRGVLVAVDGLAGRHAARLLARGVRADDPQLRAQAVEAVDSLSDRRLAQRIVPLLEGGPTPGTAGGDPTTWALLNDADPWLRALGIRAAADHVRALRSGLVDRARRDSSPLVAGALGAPEEDVMAPSDQPSGLIDRILVLQQVPMLSNLGPEDLARVAEQCVERSYDPGDVIYRQDDTGDEMFIVTAGRVRIVRHDGDAVEVLRRYGPGEHVGELSLLRGQPRVSDVVADDEGADGLALDAASFRAILDGRPEVAMAMLATLAERLGTS
jgi:AAA family ATP:ADP antiporter